MSTPINNTSEGGERKKATIRIVLADDHPIVRRGLRSLLESQPDLQVCAEAGDGAVAMELVIKDRPDLVVLDLTMPQKNGLEVTRLIRERLTQR